MFLVLFFLSIADSLFCCKSWQKPKGFFKKHLKHFKYNAFLRFSIEIYLPLTCACFLTLRSGSRSASFSAFGYFLAGFILILQVYVLGFATWLVTVKFDQLKDKKVKSKFGSIYKEMKMESKIAVLYHSFFMLQRLLIATVLVFAT